jgi:hypothetical protein
VEWVEIDRKMDHMDLEEKRCDASLEACFHAGRMSFHRMTQTGKNHCGDDALIIYAVEFFAALPE